MAERDWRAIDVLVAEHLMGLKKVLYSKYSKYTYLADDEGFKYRSLPHFSSTWAGMGEVVEAMQRDGWSFRITPQADYGGDYYRRAEFMAVDPTSYFCHHQEFNSIEELPRAVALACLKALGVTHG